MKVKISLKVHHILVLFFFVFFFYQFPNLSTVELYWLFVQYKIVSDNNVVKWFFFFLISDEILILWTKKIIFWLKKIDLISNMMSIAWKASFMQYNLCFGCHLTDFLNCKTDSTLSSSYGWKTIWCLCCFIAVSLLFSPHLPKVILCHHFRLYLSLQQCILDYLSMR